MFSNRRPTPSAKTVRLLYQLGYICSGTAFGLVTLCLEEQRRRIQILQRISDNAKIIRQHPRYRGNAALALQAGEDYENAVVGRGLMLERLGRRRKGWEGRSGDVNEHAAQDGTLPSVIEREYSEIFGSKRRRAFGVDGSRSSRPKPLPVRRDSAKTTSPWELSIETKSQTDRRGARKKTNIGDLLNFQPAELDDDLEDLQDKTRHEARSAEVVLNKETIDDTASEMRDPGEMNREDEILNASPNSSRLNGGSTEHDTNISLKNAPPLEMSPRDLSLEIERFINSTLPEHKDDRKISWVIFARLFWSALKVGSLEEIRSLHRWKTQNGSLGVDYRDSLLYTCYRLGQRFGPDELNRLFIELYDMSNSFSESPEHNTLWEFPLNLALKVHGVLCDLANGDKTYSFQRIVVDRMLHPVEPRALHGALGSATESLKRAGHISAATQLFLSITGYHCHPKLNTKTCNKLLGAAIAGRELQNSASLLRWKSKFSSLESMDERINSFVEACGEQKAYGILVDVFNCEKGSAFSERRVADVLKPSNLVVLTIAYSTDIELRSRFELLYRKVPTSLRQNVDEAAAPLSLKAMWRSSRNLAEVEKSRLRLLETLRGKGDENALRKLDEAAIEIYISANRMDDAHAMILKMHESFGASNVVLCQTAVMFAKRESWGLLSRLIDMLKRSESFHFDNDARRVFDETIRVYSKHHTADETWDFVTSAVQDLGFTPSRSTSKIVLKSFVQQKKISYIPQWLDFLTEIDCNTEIDAEMMVLLLRHYSVIHRPSHVFIMWLCRRLTLLSPSVASEDLVRLVEEAIGYDLRHLFGVNARWQEEHARMRLARVEGSKGFIPSPGFVWNEQLLFPDSEIDLRNLSGTGEVTELLDESLDEISTEDAEDSADDMLEISSDLETEIEGLQLADEGDSSLPTQPVTNVDLDFAGRKRIEGDMWLQLSQREYQKVLDAYNGSLDAAGCPASPDTLELALHASLKLHGDRSNADEMIRKAQEAGMDTASAIAPLLIFQLNNYDPKANVDVASLWNAVLSYYQSKSQNGEPIKRHLATKASQFLIVHNKANEGLALLWSIYFTKCAKELRLNYVAMTVFLKGYIFLQDLEGIKWVVETVLAKNIRIGARFMAQLKYLIQGDFKWMNRHSSNIHPQLTSWVESCAERREQQTEEIHKVGWDLVKVLAKSSPNSPNIDIDTPTYLEDGSFDEDIFDRWDSKDMDFVDESYFSDEARSEPEEDTRYAEMQKKLVEDWRAERQFRQRLRAAALAQGRRDKISPLYIPDVSEEGVAEVVDDVYGMEAPSTWELEGDVDEASLASFKPFA